MFDINFQLREEFGYEVNPDDPQFAEKIAEKEKEFAKAKKLAKKQKHQEAVEDHKAKKASEQA